MSYAPFFYETTYKIRCARMEDNMNYGKKGVRRRQQSLTSRSTKIAKMLGITAFKIILLGILTVGVVGLCAGVGLFKGVLDSSPELSVLDLDPSGFSTAVYDSEGNQITTLVAADSNRKYQTIEKIPLDLQHAFVAIEDERFYEHNGIDIKGIVRAAFVGLRNGGRFTEGASTITQQLLKNNVFKGWTDESTFAERLKRKIQEQYLAIEVEKTVQNKDLILEKYMNTINLGQNTLGVQTASLRYFNKSVSDLTLSECAVIAAITQNPAKYNPITHPEENEKRRSKVLSNMLDQGYITQGAYEEAIEDDVYSRIKNVNEENEESSIYTYFVDELTEQVIQDLQDIKGYAYTQAYNTLFSGGLSIYTTQDPKIQRICDEVMLNEENFPSCQWLLEYELSIETKEGEQENFSTQMMDKYYKDKKNIKSYGNSLLFSSKEAAMEEIEAYKSFVMEDTDLFIAEKVTLTPQPQASITVMDQSTGHVVAIVGGRGTKEASLTLNRATNTTRQPGSTFKVVSTYAPALDSAGMTLATVKIDEPFNYANGRPVSNWYSSGYKGPCTLRYAIEQSLNIIAVKTLTDITPQLGFDYLQNFGFTTLVSKKVQSDNRVVSDITQSLALGGITDGVTNLELNAAYGAIANMGTYTKPLFYTKILDHNGDVLIENEPQTRQVIKETTAYLLTSAMEDVVTKGTGGSVNFGNMPIAGKTGTTSDYNDVWFSGYTPYYTATTWAGYDNNYKLTGSDKNLAKTLWKNVMSQIHEGLEHKSFTTPKDITTATVCRKSGKLAGATCMLDGSTISEYFATGTEPTETCDSHISGFVCSLTGLRASETCPYRVEGSITINPLGADLATAGYCPHSYANGVPLFDPATIPGQIDPNTNTIPILPGTPLPTIPQAPQTVTPTPEGTIPTPTPTP